MTVIKWDNSLIKTLALDIYRAVGGISTSMSYAFDFSTNGLFTAIRRAPEPSNYVAARDATLLLLAYVAERNDGGGVYFVATEDEGVGPSAEFIGTVAGVSFGFVETILDLPAWGYELRMRDLPEVVSEVPNPGDRGLVMTTQDNLRVFRPNEELLATIPERARSFAIRVDLSDGGSDRGGYLVFHNGQSNYLPDSGEVNFTAEELLSSARVAYREWLRASMGRSLTYREDPAVVEKRRQAAAERFSAFVRRQRDEVQHVPTLPFVPNGLSSSRRWGIEVESGGARGVGAPAHWERKYDGSLRSAWDGYREVQDFEPFDEEVTEFIRVSACENRSQHQFELEEYNSSTDRYEYRQNPNYLDPAQCELCGERTTMVHREPQTIVHNGRDNDCGEFVSPILVSMHSKGLKEILDQLILQPQNQSAGVHVHVEADDLTPEQVATLIFGYDILEPILEASYQREARRYCQRRDVSGVLEMARKLRPGKGVTQQEVRGGDRYVTLNTTALNAHGTIEFRAMGPVYDYDYLVRWAMLCRELVNIVAAGVTTKRFSKVKSWNDLTMLLAEYGKEYMRAVVYEQTGETGHAADLIKRGQEVTVEALDRDLSDFIAANPTPQWRPLMDTFRNRIVVADELQAVGLVSVGSVDTGGRYWAV